MDAMTPLLSLLDRAEAHARLGELDKAEKLVHQVRTGTGIENSPMLATRVMMIEGCVAAYRGQWTYAKDRLLRSMAIHHARSETPDLHLAKAWLSYAEFNAGSLDRAAELASEVIEGASQDETLARFRAGTVLASLYYLANLADDGARWFNFSKREAEKLRQTGLTSAVMFDMAAMRVCIKRFNSIIRSVEPQDLKLDLLLSRSASNFDRYGDVSVMGGLHFLLEGQILFMLKDFEQARELFGRAEAAKEHLPSTSQAQLELELICVAARLSDGPVQGVGLRNAMHILEKLIDDDDVAVYARQLSDICRRIGLHDDAESLRRISDEAAERFVEWQEAFAQRLSRGSTS